MKPKFEPGENIAIKVPPHQFKQSVAFYRDILGLEQVYLDTQEQYNSVTFKFGDKNLWIDEISSLSQAEIWLEIKTDNITDAAQHFKDNKIARRDEIEPLPDDFNGFWIASPANIIHLITD